MPEIAVDEDRQSANGKNDIGRAIVDAPMRVEANAERFERVLQRSLCRGIVARNVAHSSRNATRLSCRDHRGLTIYVAALAGMTSVGYQP
jgi:hypothetical protein